MGVSSFEDERFAEVPFAVDDAIDLAYLFAVELKLLLPKRAALALSGEPRKPESQKRLAELLEAGSRRFEARQVDFYRHLSRRARASSPEGLFLLTIATHGMSDQGGDFLIARDSLPERTVRTGVAVDELFDEVSKAPARRRLVLLDACRERLSEETRSLGAAAMARSFADAIARASGQVVLAGATHGGYAYDDMSRGNGVFTGAVLDGLRGAAPADSQGLITVRTLADFVQERVSEWTRLNRPEHVEASRGIGRRVEGPAESLPLAVNPAISEAFEAYGQRRSAALTLLRENLGKVLTGGLYDRILEELPEARPVAAKRLKETELLLEEVEALDGSVRSRRSLRDFLRERHPAPEPDPGPGEPDPDLGEPEPDPGPGEPEPGWPAVSRQAYLVAAVVLAGILVAGVWGLSQGSSEQEPAIGSENQADAGRAGETPHQVPPSGDVELPKTPPLPAASEAGAEWSGPLGMRFRYVPSGTYTVGSPEDEPGRFDWEWPRHQARLTRGFWLAETELTQNQWSELVQKNPSQFKDCGGSCPVERVSWFEAARFANRLSEQEGLDSCYALEGCTGSLGEGDYSCDYVRFEGLDCPGYRLPTEAEWEVAARAGNPTAIYAPELDFIAWYGGNSGRQTHRAGRKEPNAWGLADMLGNVYEWTGDGSTDFAPATGVVVDPLGAKGGANRVFRGGSWSDFARYVRAAFRNDGHPSFRVDNLGFRLARGQVSSGEAEPRVR